MKIIGSTWFTTANGSCIGIVLGIDEITKERKAYIGVGDGYDESVDELNISKLGAKFLPIQVAQLDNHFNPPPSQGA